MNWVQHNYSTLRGKTDKLEEAVNRELNVTRRWNFIYTVDLVWFIAWMSFKLICIFWKNQNFYSRVGWGYSVQKRCFFRHFFDFYKDFEKKFYLMVSYSWKVVTTHYLSYPSLFGGLKGPPFFYRSWVIRIAPHGASRITLGVFKKKGPLGPLIPKFWLKTIRTWKLTCYLWYGTRSETKKRYQYWKIEINWYHQTKFWLIDANHGW